MVQVHHAPLKLKPSSLTYWYIEKLPTPWRVIGDARLTIDDQSRTASGWLCWRKRWHDLKELIISLRRYQRGCLPIGWRDRAGVEYMGAVQLSWAKRITCLIRLTY